MPRGGLPGTMVWQLARPIGFALCVVVVADFPASTALERGTPGRPPPAATRSGTGLAAATREVGATHISAVGAAGSPGGSAPTRGATDSPVWLYSVANAATGEPLYSMRGWSEAVADEPERVAVVSESRFPGGVVRRDRAVFTREEPPRCLLFESTSRSAAGEVLGRSLQRFAPGAFPLLRRPLPDDAYPPEAPLGWVLARLGLGKRSSAGFHTVVAGSVIGVELWVDGRETVRVPAGEFEAYRIHMRATAESLFPDVPRFVQRFASMFIPRQTIWLTTREPQILLRFVGKMGPPGTPDLRVELTEIAGAVTGAAPGPSTGNVLAGREASASPPGAPPSPARRAGQRAVGAP